MKYKINAFILYDAVDGTLSLKEDEVDTQLSITANALLFYFIQHRGVVSRDEVLKAVWDDNGLVSSNSNLNQYLSILRKAFRPYGIENIIVTVARGRLEFNSDVSLELIDDIKIPQTELITSLSEIEAAAVVLSPIPKPISVPKDPQRIESTLTPEKKKFVGISLVVLFYCVLFYSLRWLIYQTNRQCRLTWRYLSILIVMCYRMKKWSITP
nr:winged helix family transcriptional regulator [Providencia rettgeri]